MLAIRPLRNICKVFFQARCLSTLLAVGKQKTEAFSVIDPDEIKLKEIVNLRGRKFLPGGDKDSFPQFLSGPKPDFPLALKAEGHYSIEDWGKLCREEIDGSLYEFGAILFRDLPLATTDDFQQLFASIGFPAMNYIGGSAHRENVAFQVYSASDEPPDCCIDLHNEMSYSPVYNNKFFFFCVTPPERGGESVLCKNSDLFAQLDKKYVKKIEEKRIRYIRHCPDGASSNYLSWQKVFEVETKEEAEAEMKMRNFEWKWHSDNNLTFWYLLDAFAPHYVTGEKVWFNQAHAMHASYFKAHPSFYGLNIPDHTYPFHATFGDGEEFEPEFLQQIRDAGWRSAVGIPWKSGDVIALDNMQVQHARLSFEGKRKIVVALSN
eukprot:Seg1974.4 transcript_id=Seg1974.4/GoldUCD/mRNA.D3Y31 product="Dapdiamide synthesis protein DdaC" protein_id=Seg1974.4/GoldUCD/D3Y31